jgi:outer membrane protein assembly factor BamB
MMYVLPLALTTWGLFLAGTWFLRWPVRRLWLVVSVALTLGYFDLVRLEGFDGMFAATLRWRWQPTAEEQFLAGRSPAPGGEALDGANESTTGSDNADLLALQPGDWPEFRGPARDSRLAGVRIRTDWNERPPRELWRHRVGPGWSSFSVVGTRLFTQEQHGDDEVVVCYDADTGKTLWLHRDKSRFSEPIAGPGPRATPTFHEGRLYTQGAAGWLNCLDARTGQAIWSRDILAEAGLEKAPDWGFAASPLVFDQIVSVFAAGGKENKGVLAYDAATGAPVWSAGDGEYSYCSLQAARLGDVDQLLHSTEKGLAGYDPADGRILWQHDWQLEKMARVVQPAVLDNGDLLIGTGFGYGLRRVSVAETENGWSTAEAWTTRAIKPYYNDFVIHGGHLYGFDGNLFVCISLDDAAKPKWRARGYGNGEVLLIVDQNLLLILSEQGEVALVEATPDAHREIARFKAIQGKAWNHPVVAHGKLFVRNGEEAACFDVGENPVGE